MFLWCSGDRQSLLNELYSILPWVCSQDKGMARAYSPWKQPWICNSPGYTSQLSLIPVSPREKIHLVLEVPAVVLARVPSKPQSPTSSGVLLNEYPFVCHVTSITDLSHLHTEDWNLCPHHHHHQTV